LSKDLRAIDCLHNEANNTVACVARQEQYKYHYHCGANSIVEACVKQERVELCSLLCHCVKGEGARSVAIVRITLLRGVLREDRQVNKNPVYDESQVCTSIRSIII